MLRYQLTPVSVGHGQSELEQLAGRIDPRLGEPVIRREYLRLRGGQVITSQLTLAEPTQRVPRQDPGLIEQRHLAGDRWRQHDPVAGLSSIVLLEDLFPLLVIAVSATAGTSGQRDRLGVMPADDQLQLPVTRPGGPGMQDPVSVLLDPDRHQARAAHRVPVDARLMTAAPARPAGAVLLFPVSAAVTQPRMVQRPPAQAAVALAGRRCVRHPKPGL